MAFYIGSWWPFLLCIFVPYAIYISMHSLAGSSVIRNRISLILRILLLLILILALANIQIVKNSQRLNVLFLLDQSASIPSYLQEQAKKFIQTSMRSMRQKQDRTGLLLFAKEASFEFIDQRAGYRFTKIDSQVDHTQTNLSGALKLAIAQLADVGQRRIVLLSDGNQTVGDCSQEMEQAQATKIPIDVLPLRAQLQKEVLIKKVVAPTKINEGQAFEVSAIIYSSHNTTGEISLMVDGREVYQGYKQFPKGKKKIPLLIPAPYVRAGFKKLKISISSTDDTTASNNSAETFTYVHGIPKILYLESDKKRQHFLYQALTALERSSKNRIHVQLGIPSDLPNNILTLTSYDALIFSNISSQSLAKNQMKMIENAVKEGGMGFVMIGGENSFGAGGYLNTPIEKILPVKMDITHKKIVPNGALVLILHTCEFPDGNYWAKTISKKAIERLSKDDLAGILYFDWSTRESWLFTLKKTTRREKNKMFRLIESASPGDMPSFASTLQAAYAALLKAQAMKKHIIIITDGDPSPPTQQQLQRIQKAKISISTIVIQPHSGQDTTRMRYICSLTKGRYYRVDNPQRLPAIFVRETLEVKRSHIFESVKGFYPRFGGTSDILQGLQNFPKLYGYVVTSPKPAIKMPLYILNKGEKDPLLAQMQCGLGRTVAFTSDVKNRWAADWVSWADYRKFWVQTVRWVLRKVDRSNFQLSHVVQQGKAHIAIDAISQEGESIYGLEMQGAVVRPDGTSLVFPVVEKGQARYEGEFSADQVGIYLISVSYREKSSGQRRSITSGLTVSYSSEYLSSSPNLSLLHKIAASTGGRVLSRSNPSSIFIHGAAGKGTPEDLWPLLLMLFLAIFPLDVFIRRVIIDYSKLWNRCLVYFRGMDRKKLESTTTMAKLAQRQQHVRENLKRKKPLNIGQLSMLEHTHTKQPHQDQANLKQSKQKKSTSPIATEKSTEVISYTSRLLKAKRKAWEKKHKSENS